jgi:tetratricopeptide (TPR) repeat protein
VRSERLSEAAGWGARAVRLAGRAGDTDARASALVALGHMACGAQRYGEAERLFALARRYARTRRAAEREGDALRGLALVRHAQERDEEALSLVLDALTAYGARPACVRALARTLLVMWLDASEYVGVQALGKHFLALPLSAQDELAVCALCARAAAALGWELHYESVCLRAILALGMLPAGAPHAPAVLDLARAHGSLGFWPRVVLAADRALSDAQSHGDRETAAIAGRMLETAALERIPDDLLTDLFPDMETEEIPEGDEPAGWEPIGKAVAAFADALGAA